jgi:hypothetical protein
VRRIAESRSRWPGAKPRIDDVSSVMWGAIREESARLVERHPELGAEDMHTATLAALAVGAGARLSRIAESLEFQRMLARVRDAAVPALLFGIPHKPFRDHDSAGASLPARDVAHRRGAVASTRHARSSVMDARTVAHAFGDARCVGRGQSVAASRALVPGLRGKGPDPFRMSLDYQDRDFLVRLMGDWTQRRGRRAFQPRPSTAHRLHLSYARRADRHRRHWDPRRMPWIWSSGVIGATLGRDHYVRVVYGGIPCAIRFTRRHSSK